MIWLSVDPANKTGIALWHDGELVNTFVMRPIGKKGGYVCCGRKYPSRHAAHVEGALACIDAIVIEEGCGRFASAIKSQAEMRGYWRCACESLDIAFNVINVSEWRRVIRERYGVSWPATTERKKALSVALVKEHFCVDVSDDESDAVLLGAAAMLTGVIPCKLGSAVRHNGSGQA